MAELVHFSGALLSVACAVLLYRNYRRTQTRLLLWSSLCFFFLALNNVFICADLIIFPDLEMGGRLVRNGLLAMAAGLMLYGLIEEFS